MCGASDIYGHLFFFDYRLLSDERTFIHHTCGHTARRKCPSKQQVDIWNYLSRFSTLYETPSASLTGCMFGLVGDMASVVAHRKVRRLGHFRLNCSFKRGSAYSSLVGDGNSTLSHIEFGRTQFDREPVLNGRCPLGNAATDIIPAAAHVVSFLWIRAETM